jgi:DNA mismatch repair protein MutS
MALVSDYLVKTSTLQLEYGAKSVVLMQVGAFYEIYGTVDNNSTINTVASICELMVSAKSSSETLMAGFRDYSISKYLNKLQTNGFTVAVYNQEVNSPTNRSLNAIYSPGTFFTNDDTFISNNTSCVWLNKTSASNITIGMSNVDIYTGKSTIFEGTELYNGIPVPTSFDQLERFISINIPSEVIIIHNLDDSVIPKIINFSGITHNCIHIVSLLGDISEKNNVRAINAEKQPYQHTLLKQIYGPTVFDDVINDVSNYPTAVQSLTFLLNFLSDHNPHLLHKISPPVFENYSDRLILANHTLKQLNIISNDSTNGKLKSISDFLNVCITPIGKRRLRYTLVNPSKNHLSLKCEYAITDFLLNEITENQTFVSFARSTLYKIKDIEKLTRKLALNKIDLKDVVSLHKDISVVISLCELVVTKQTLLKYFIDNKINIPDIINSCFIIQNSVSSVINIDTFDTNIDTHIKIGFDVKHDIIHNTLLNNLMLIECIRTFFNSKIGSYEKKDSSNFVRIHETDKIGMFLFTTKRRARLLKDLKGQHTLYYGENLSFILDCDNINFVNSTNGANNNIHSLQINAIYSEIGHTKNILIESNNNIFNNLIHSLDSYIYSLNDINTFIGSIDLCCARAHLATKYQLSKPKIKVSKKPFFKATGIRHPLIEQLLHNELYISNDISFDNNNLGYLLFGTNAVGKSSFIKSIGINVIMAQAGFFVPCKSFEFFPYTHIFTRILGNDDIFKGLSTFSVEMLELKTILTQSNSSSLILGDELCSGTENDSAISIFLAGLDYLYTRKCHFIFATHFHIITKYEEITSKPKLHLKHMFVSYDKSKDILVYDRKLREGPGESMYGLEVCKSLHLPQDFLDNAHNIRNKYSYGISHNVLDFKTSHFNVKKIKGVCEICNIRQGTEVHHLQPQHLANDADYIKGEFHKNHVANLMCVCEECHNTLHAQNTTHKRTMTTNGITLENV